MLLWPVDTKPLGGHLEFLGSETKGQEREDPYQDPDSLSREALQCACVHGLRAESVSLGRPTSGHSLVPQPVPEINALDHCRGPFVAFETDDCFEHVFDVAMAPVLALDGGDGGDIWDVSGQTADREVTYFRRQRRVRGRGGGGELLRRGGVLGVGPWWCVVDRVWGRERRENGRSCDDIAKWGSAYLSSAGSNYSVPITVPTMPTTILRKHTVY